MKLTIFNGITHDLANYLDNGALTGYYRDMDYPIQREVLQNKDSFDKSMIVFVKERLPKSFDWKRIKHIKVSIIRSGPNIDSSVEIKVDDKKFQSRVNL